MRFLFRTTLYHAFRRVFLDLLTLYGYNGVDHEDQSEVTSINKQKFLAELSKLLTFMYEEDRQRAIEMYSRMFDEAGDERVLIQSLVSPTRQAVIVARAYNSNLGRLSLTSESKAAPEDRDDNGVPDYVQAIEDVRAKAWAAQGLSVEENPEESSEKDDASEKMQAETEETEETPAEVQEENSADTEEPAEEQSGEELTEEPAEETEDAAESEEPAENDAGDDPETDEAGEREEAAAEEPDEDVKAVPEAKEAPVPEAVEEAKPSEPHEGIEYFTMPEEGKESPESELLLDENSFNVDSDALRKTRKKPKVFALIVYILLAIPLTICAIAVLLIPAVLFLALSIAVIISGVVLVSAAFNGFAVFADIMVLLGISLVFFALGLLFLWTAIWFVGGAIVGVVHGVAMLCEKWCYKEVLEA